MKEKELKKWMDKTIIPVEISVSTILILHAFATLSDGRGSLTKILRKWISPTAMKILKEHKEL